MDESQEKFYSLRSFRDLASFKIKFGGSANEYEFTDGIVKMHLLISETFPVAGLAIFAKVIT